jgi:phospholipase D1/2
VQNAYLQAIADAQRYVLIENQFFISGLEDDAQVANRISQALYARISKAAAEKTPFRVVVFLPLLPAFEAGDFSDSSMRYVLYWQYRSICRGGGRSLLEMLEKDPNVRLPSDYISFFALRTFQFCKGVGAVSIYSYIFFLESILFFCRSNRELIVRPVLCEVQTVTN